MKVVVDTNVFINSIGKISPYHWLFDAVLSGKVTLCISNSIFYEYWEVLDAQTIPEVADNIANFLTIIPSVQLLNPFINWNLITDDADDNKFVDCAIAGSAECIITHDRHFNILKQLSFPKVKVVTPEEFKAFYTALRL